MRTNLQMVHNVIQSKPRNNFSELLVRIGSDADKQAFSEIFEHFAPRLKNYLMKQGSTDNQAEELVQETMLNIWRKSKQFNPEKASASTWIYTIARNKRIDKIRKEKRHYLSESDEGLEIPVDSTQEKEILVTDKTGKNINFENLGWDSL